MGAKQSTATSPAETPVYLSGLISTWGDRLHAARQAKGVTQAELARRVVELSDGAVLCDQRMVHKYEKGAHPRPYTQALIALALGRSVSSLFPRDDTEARRAR